MRATLDIAPDVLAAVKERAQQEGRPIGAVLSDAARLGLCGTASPACRPDDDEPLHGFRPLPAGNRVVTDALVDRLRDELGI